MWRPKCLQWAHSGQPAGTRRDCPTKPHPVIQQTHADHSIGLSLATKFPNVMDDKRATKPQADFSFTLTRVIEPTRGPGIELTTLTDAARFAGLLGSWRQTSPQSDYAANLLLKSAADQKAGRLSKRP